MQPGLTGHPTVTAYANICIGYEEAGICIPRLGGLKSIVRARCAALSVL